MVSVVRENRRRCLPARDIAHHLAAIVLATIAGSAPAPATEPAPVDTTVVHGSNLNFYPYVYYTPETELAFGAGGIATFYTADDRILRPSKVVLSGYYATTQQYLITINPEFYFSGNRYFTGMKLSFGHYVDKFYGVGNRTPDLGTERYIADRYGIEVNVETPPLLFFFSDRSGVIYDFQDSEIVDPGDNPYLLAGNVTGSEGGTVSGFGGSWIWDRRDHSFYPTNGGLYEFKVVVYTNSMGSDYTFWTIENDSRRYIDLAPDKVLAVQAYASVAIGEAPFYKLPALGGQRRLRGYFEGRYRDSAYFMGQVEYRQVLSGRWGYVLFAAIGDVAPDLARFHASDFKFAAGAGLRFRFNQDEKVNLRVDYGRGNDSDGVYFGLEEAF